MDEHFDDLMSRSASPQPSECFDCHPNLALSEECTDQCVVIACTDPSHSGDQLGQGTEYSGAAHNNTVDVDGDIGHCDLVYDQVYCNDCTGVDDYLACCKDYRLSSQAIDAFLCGCDLSSSTPCPPSPHQQEQHSHQHQPPPLPHAHSSAVDVPCMWSECARSFDALPDLVGHVNAEHLLQLEQSIDQACHWDNCTLFDPPLAQAQPQASTIDMLTNHFLQDHLGMKPGAGTISTSAFGGIPYNFPSFISTPMTTPSLSSNSSYSPSPMPSPADNNTRNIYPCKWKDCTQSFSSLALLTDHLASSHVGSGKASYECYWGECTRNSASPSSSSSPSCFASKQKILRHLQSHTGFRPFQCPTCGLSFSEAATLTQHVRRHTREKPYMCDFPGCGKAFAIAGALTIHKRTHDGIKPFKCKYCDRAFAESSNLTKHLRTHTGARPYACPFDGCDKAFARPDQLNRHTATVHNHSPTGVASKKGRKAKTKDETKVT